MKANAFFLAALLAAATGAQAQAQGMTLPRTMGPATSARSGLPMVDAEVRKIDRTRNMVVLKHGDIPNMGMTAMTMGFEVTDTKQLRGLEVGDKVTFQADMVEGKPTVISLKKER